MKYEVSVAGRTFEIEILHNRLVQVDGRPVYVDLDQVGGLPLYTLSLDDEEYLAFVEQGRLDYQVEVRGQNYPVRVARRLPRLSPRRPEGADDCEPCHTVNAPLAGHLISLPVATGQTVAAGQAVAVVESMKMQMTLTAPRAGVVEAVHAQPGQDVAQGEALVTLQT